MILNRCAYTCQDRSGRATCPREEGRRGKFFICAEEAAKFISRQSSQSCQQRPHAERKIKNQRARNEVWTQDSQPSPCWWRANHVRSAAPWQLARTQGQRSPPSWRRISTSDGPVHFTVDKTNSIKRWCKSSPQSCVVTTWQLCQHIGKFTWSPLSVVNEFLYVASAGHPVTGF